MQTLPKKKKHDTAIEWLNSWFLSIPCHSTLTLFKKPIDKHEMQQIFVTPKIAQCTPCTLLFTRSMVLPWTFLSFQFLVVFFFLTCDVLSRRWHKSKTKTYTPSSFFLLSHSTNLLGNETQTKFYNELIACLFAM